MRRRRPNPTLTLALTLTPTLVQAKARPERGFAALLGQSEENVRTSTKMCVCVFVLYLVRFVG